MAKSKTEHAAARYVNGRRIDLKQKRERRKANRERASQPPIEDTRVAMAWARQEQRDAVARLDKAVARAMADEIKRSRIEPQVQDRPNPMFMRDHAESTTNPREIPVVINVRESAIATLAARKDKDGNPLIDECQVKAADRFREYWEAMGGSGAAAMDFTREPVDGGGARDPLSDRMLNAQHELNRAKTHLGARGYELVSKVCGLGYGFADIFEDKRQRLTAADNLRQHLDDLAVLWRLAVIPSKSARRDQAAARAS